MTQKLDTTSLMQISLFEKITHAKVKDCFEDNFKQLVFCVQPRQLFQAIGKNGAHVKKIEQLMKKKIRVIEFNQEIAGFIQSLCYPHKVSVEYEKQMLWDSEKHVAVVTPADAQARGYLIGKGASNLRNMENICRRYFKIDEIRVT